MKEFALPNRSHPTNFQRSEGLSYEAEEVRQCLARNQKESVIMSLDTTQLVADIMDKVIAQIQENKS